MSTSDFCTMMFKKHPSYVKCFEKTLPSSFKNVYNLYALLMAETRTKREYTDAGRKLSAGRLYKTRLNNPNIFVKKSYAPGVNSSLTWLIDNSGSMGKNKTISACVSAAMILQLSTAFNIPLEILGFTEALNYGPINCVYKSFDKPCSIEILFERMASSQRYKIQNSDGDSILWAWHRTLRSKSKRKLLTVISDGSPAADKSGDIYGYTKDVVRMIEQDKRVEIYGVGVEDNAVQRIYTNFELIEDASDLEDAMLKLFKQYILM